MIKELDQYQKEVIKTLKPMELVETNKYCCMKLCEESGEISSLFSKYYFHGKEFNKEKLKEEIGDLFYYIAAVSNTNGFNLSEIATFNIEKLRKRHGEKYNQEFYMEKI